MSSRLVVIVGLLAMLTGIGGCWNYLCNGWGTPRKDGMAAHSPAAGVPAAMQRRATAEVQAGN